jgi:MFS family permease
VATLQLPIGDYFQQAHIASYIGTSYLLSVCCFTPLYGRLSDTLGRKVSQRPSAWVFFTDEFHREQWCAIHRHFRILF